MPLKLVPPRPGKTPNWGIRGTYLRIAVDRSTGTPRKAVAARIKRDLERAIERGEYSSPRQAQGAPTFLSAAVDYLKTGGSPRYVARLIEHFGETPIDDIDQAAIDRTALTLCPDTTAATRNRSVYTPTSAILHSAGSKIAVKRPKGAKGRIITDHLNPPDALPILEECYKIDPKFGLLIKFLLYTGCRIGETLNIQRKNDLRLNEQRAWVSASKNEDPREVVLRADLCEEIARYIGDDWVGPLFPWRYGANLNHKLRRAKLAYLGLDCPVRRPIGWREPQNRLSFLTLHIYCHTWATWMRRYGGLDQLGLVGTRRWRDARSVARYAHVVARDEWDRVEMLPSIGRKVG